MDHLTLFAGAGMAAVAILYAGIQIGMRLAQHDGEQIGAAKMLRLLATATRQR